MASPRLCAVACVALLVSSVAAQDRAVDRPADLRRTIAVTGHGEVDAPPDRAELSFAVETTGAKASEAAAENAKRSAAVAAAVKPLLDASDTVATTRYALEPRYDVPRPGEPREPRITGYVARNEVRVETRRVDQVGALVDAAATAGANRVGGLRFTLSRPLDAQREALEKAGADARAQAESIAKGLGVRLKAVIAATTFGAPMPLARRFEPMAMEAKVATPIEPGEVQTSVTLQVTYEIE